MSTDNKTDSKEVPLDSATAGYNSSNNASDNMEPPQQKLKWWQHVTKPGSAWQIIGAAALAIIIGMIVNTQVDDFPEAARVILSIPGDLWLRALKAVVLPLILCAMILAIQRLRNIPEGGSKLAKWTIGWYVITTIFSVILSTIMTSQVWAKQFTPVSREQLEVTEDDPSEELDEENKEIYNVVLKLFQSLVANNIVSVLANDELLAVLVIGIVLGYLIKDKNSTFLKLVVEFEVMITRVITILIYLAPVGVFFLILSNIVKLDLAEIGKNLGFLIGGTLSTMAMHIFIVLPLLFFIFARENPYAYWIKIAPAWVTAWGSASSAATLPVTLRVAEARGIPRIIYKFTCPLGCLINMDGTAIYFPMAVVFLAATQGDSLSAVDYIIIILLSTLASIGTTPIPSSSLVLTVMIANSIDVEITGMYGVILAIDWFLDRFRTAINVSGDLFASRAIYKILKLEDTDYPEEMVQETDTYGQSQNVTADNRV